MQEDIVIPLFQTGWSTRSVLEGLNHHYSPKRIWIICPEDQCDSVVRIKEEAHIPQLEVVPEDDFFAVSFDLSKDDICSELDLEKSLYSPGWFYQQILKLGAFCGCKGLSEDFLIWDADLLPVATWPVVKTDEAEPHYFALLQHKSRGNQKIISAWETWIQTVLGVEPVTDAESSYVPHHMWFNQSICQELFDHLAHYFESDDPWPLLMMRSANQFGTFSEFWLYASWLNQHHPNRLKTYPYARYGISTERFFDDGTGKLTSALRAHMGMQLNGDDRLSPSYSTMMTFLKATYGADLPSSLSFEASPRHKKKGRANMHLEELRSRWHIADEEL